MKLSNPFESIVATIIGILGIVVTILYPWPAEWIAGVLSIGVLPAKLITIALILLLILIPLLVVNGVAKRMSRRVKKKPNTVFGVTYKAVPDTLICDLLLETLIAFEEELIARSRELINEHELTRENRSYHAKRLRELLDLRLLDCALPCVLRSLAGTEWAAHVASRDGIERKLREICELLGRRFVHPKYTIPLGGYEAEALLKRVRQEINKLKKMKEAASGS